ncbi:hypothetical protein MTsPCn7_13940 [Altererythrobacter sp. MTPC7]
MAILRRFSNDQSGATLMEFGLIAPVLMTLLMGIFDISYNIYATAILEGAMQEAGRNSTIENATTSTIDNRVEEQVHAAVPNASITFARTAYAEYTDIGRPEDFTDLNSDGVCNDGEPFEDVNANGVYDTDRGLSGQGGARNAVVLKATMTFDRFFPVASFVGLPSTYTTSSTTVLRNQPYDINEVAPATENCL